MAEAHEAIGPSGSGKHNQWHKGHCNASSRRQDNCTSSEIKLEMMGLGEGGRKSANTTSSLVERIGPVTSETKTRMSEKELNQGKVSIPFWTRRPHLY